MGIIRMSTEMMVGNTNRQPWVSKTDHRSLPGSLRRMLRISFLATTGLATVLMVSGCAVTPQPMTTADIKAVVEADLKKVFQRQEPLGKPLTVYDAMARVLKYDLDNRLKMMEEALSLNQLDVANVSMLPQIVTSAGYVSRSNISASSSQSVTTGVQSLETSTSQEQYRRVADLGLTWNILDFGVSYIAAKQQADRTLVAAERRRKVIQNTLQDTRQVFWRAAAADRLQGRVTPLLKRIERALADSQTIAQQQLASPTDALAYQRALLRTRQQLLDTQRELQLAKTQLSALMDLPSGTDITFDTPSVDLRKAPLVKLTPEIIENIALARRPEMVEEVYQARIGSDETRKAMLRMLPGINLSFGPNYDSNRFLLHHNWIDYGAKVSWSLFNLFTGPANVALAEQQEAFIETRRLALSIAVLTQSRVSWLRYDQAIEDWRVAQDVAKVERRYTAAIHDQVDAQRRGELDYIQAEFEALIADLRADLAFAETQNAAGNILVTMGFDPLPETLSSADISAVAAALREREAAWFAGQLPAELTAVPTKPGADNPPLAQTAPPSAAPEKPIVTAAAVQPQPPMEKAAGKPAATWPDPIVPAVAPVSSHYRVFLGTYATKAQAQRGWDALTRQAGGTLPEGGPVYVTDRRQNDGRTFVVLRTSDFADKTAAQTFCGAIHDRHTQCEITSRFRDPGAE